MLHSLRWRIIISYVILSLLSVSLAGILALSIVSHFANQQEEEYLQKIGEAIAQESAQYFWPLPNYKKLTQLTNSASFFGNVRVRILYPNDKVIQILVWLKMLKK